MKKKIEAALFISGKSMSLAELCNVAESSENVVKKALKDLRAEYDSRDSSIIITSEEGYFKMELRSEYLKQVRPLAPHMDMKRAVIMILSHIAYKQPITQSTLVKKFGNRVYEYVRELEKRGLINSERYRHTKRLTTTTKLYSYLGGEDLETVKKSLEAAKAKLDAEKKEKDEAFKPKFKTRKRKREVPPERDMNIDSWVGKIKDDKQKDLAKQMENFEKQHSEKKMSEEEDYLEVFELKGGADNGEEPE